MVVAVVVMVVVEVVEVVVVVVMVIGTGNEEDEKTRWEEGHWTGDETVNKSLKHSLHYYRHALCIIVMTK